MARLQGLFGTDTLPSLELDLEHFPALIAPEIGKMSISGMQRKSLVRRSNDRKRLVVATRTSRYILEPQIERYVHDYELCA